MKLHIDLFGAGKLDIEPNGAFFRSRLHDRRGDPHASFFWLPEEGSDENTPHLTRKKQKRVWLPKFKHDRFLDFLARYQAAALRSWLAGLRRIDLALAERAGWRFCASMPPSFIHSSFCEDGPNDVNWRVSSDSLLTTIEHTLVASERPLHFWDRGPGGLSPIIAAVRWHHRRLAGVANAVWLEYGGWDPFALEEPVQVVPRGWYWLPDRIMTKKRFMRLLGREGRSGVKLAKTMTESFFGPTTRKVDADAEAFAERVREILRKARE